MTIVQPPTTVTPDPSPNCATASSAEVGNRTSVSCVMDLPSVVGERCESNAALSQTIDYRFLLVVGQACCLPAMPQCFGSTPWITTWMCDGSAPDVSSSALVRASIIFGTDSSVTRLSDRKSVV